MSIALATEDYALASEIKSVVDARRHKAAEEAAAAAVPSTTVPVDLTASDWEGVGAPSWLASRLVDLGYTLPTPVQRVVATALLTNTTLNLPSAAVVASSTGSGKTLAYCVPMLSALSDSFNAVGALRRLGAGNTIRPIAMVVVPTRELGAQVALTLYSLLGGDPPRRQHTPGSRLSFFNYDGPTGVRVMGLFSDDDVERAKSDCLLNGISIVVGTPKHLAAAATELALPEAPGEEPEPPLDISALRAVVLDEADACWTDELMEYLKILLRDPGEMWELLQMAKASSEAADDGDFEIDMLERQMAANRDRVTIFAGATITDAIVRSAVDKRWLLHPALCSADGASMWEQEDVSEDGEKLAAEELAPPLPSGLRHAVITTSKEFPERRMAALARVLRAAEADHRATPHGGGGPHRCVVYCGSDDVAKAASKALRTALWGTHVVSVLLPELGAQQLGILDDYRHGDTTLLVIGPAGARGLDLGDTLLHCVACLGAPSDVSEYAHRAGRCGRIVKSAPDLTPVDEPGESSPSAFARRAIADLPPLVVSAVTEGQEYDQLMAVCRQLNIELEEMAEPEAKLAEARAFLDTAGDESTWSEEQRDAVLGALEDVVSLLDADTSVLPEEERGRSSTGDDDN